MVEMRGNSSRFEAAMWVYLGSAMTGITYALWKGASFFPAMRQAEFQFIPIEQSGNFDDYTPFVNSVISTWPQRIAAYPSTWAVLASVAWMIVIVAVAFRLTLSHPRGRPLSEAFTSEAAGRVISRARNLARFDGLLFERTDGLTVAGAGNRSVYLPITLTQKIGRRLVVNAAEQVAFVIRHEISHSSSSDNALWSFGRTLAVVTTGVIGTLLVQPLIMMFAMLLPIIAGGPLAIYLPVIACLAAGSLALLGLVTSGLLPSLTAAREFFADQAAVSLVGADALPYEGAGDRLLVGTVADEWRMGALSPDRRLHTIGIAPATGALAAFSIGTWAMIRTIILMVDYDRGFVATSALDLCCLASLIVMLGCLPKPVAAARQRGLLAWLLLALVVTMVFVLFGEIRSFSASFGVTQIVTMPWLIDLALPPAAAAVAILCWRRPTAAAGVLTDVDRLRPGFPRPTRIALVLLSLPSIFASYAVGSFALMNSATTLGSWCFGDFGDAPALLQNAVGLLVALAFIWLVARNMTLSNVWAYAAELVAAAFVGGLMVYFGLVLIQLPRSAPLGPSGPPVDVPSAETALMSLPRSPVIIALTVFTGLLLLLAGPFWARYRLRWSDTQRFGG